MMTPSYISSGDFEIHNNSNIIERDTTLNFISRQTKEELKDTNKQIILLDLIERNWNVKELTKENLIKLLVLLELNSPDFIFKQAIIESGEFKSQLAKQGNNLFGMRKATQRRNLAKEGRLLGYAMYIDWRCSVLDYYYWQSSSPVKHNELYSNYLQRRKYAASSSYGKRISKVNFKDVNLDSLINFYNSL